MKKILCVLISLILFPQWLSAQLSAPVIITQPISQTKHIGDSVTFTVTATGNPVPKYQWFEFICTNFGGVPSCFWVCTTDTSNLMDTISGNTIRTSKYKILATYAGSYPYEVGIWNSQGYVMSAICTLTVIPTVRIQKSVIKNQKFAISVNNMCLRYTLPAVSDVKVRIFDLKGRLVFSSIIQRQSVGAHTLPLTTISPGRYVLDFSTDAYKVCKEIIMMKR